jgi:hypothetical protein
VRTSNETLVKFAALEGNAPGASAGRRLVIPEGHGVTGLRVVVGGPSGRMSRPVQRNWPAIVQRLLFGRGRMRASY